MLVNVEIVIRYQKDIPDDPAAYEGATTDEERMTKDGEYLVEGGDYLLQDLSSIEHYAKATITKVAES